MLREISFQHESWPLKKSFSISRGTKTSAEIIYLEIKQNHHKGKGEAVPYARYGESIDSVISQINAVRGDIEQGSDRSNLLNILPPGAARNAIDCALWDLESKLNGISPWEIVNQNKPKIIHTALTVSLSSPDKMAEEALNYGKCDVLKLKLGSENVLESISAVRQVAPKTKIIVDANEAWCEEKLRSWQEQLLEMNVDLVEQPLPSDKENCLGDFQHLVPICADESCHTTEDIERLAGLYDYVNLKLDKTGGLTEALNCRDMAKELRLGLMIGCMVSTSLSMAPALLLAEDADFIDLDGPFLLARDRDPSLISSSGELVYNSSVWG
ncbi:MAG: N-acetyl-D-Glu racemase DgcA [Pseudomonadota bacterium]|nr:N-acetyl-D-Glu racemase DgcA [Pseudomonadota bacterium]